MAYYANGTDYHSSGTLPMTATGEFTLMCWVFLETTSENGNFFCIGREGGGTNNGYEFGVGATGTGDAGNDLIASFNGVGALDSNFAIGTGWHHCALSFKDDNVGRDAIFYIDGEEKVLGDTNPPNAPTLGWAIGARLTTAVNSVDKVLTAGNRVAHIKVFDKRLSRGEVISEMNSYKPVNKQNLKAWLPIDENTGTLVSDRSKTYTASLQPGGTAPLWESGPPMHIY